MGYAENINKGIIKEIKPVLGVECVCVAPISFFTISSPDSRKKKQTDRYTGRQHL
jgi:hypothetical protein